MLIEPRTREAPRPATQQEAFALIDDCHFGDTSLVVNLGIDHKRVAHVRRDSYAA
jgi:hypothetical protein